MLGLLVLLSSCGHSASTRKEVVDTVAIDVEEPSILLTDAQLLAEEKSKELPEELFDDFLYNYMQDTAMQHERVTFPLRETVQADSVHLIAEEDWNEDYCFQGADYTIALYANEDEMCINEDTALTRASVEKIDLEGQTVSIYDFMRLGKRWYLVGIRNISFAQSDLNEFLHFYSHFAGDVNYRNNSLAHSIRISVANPEDESQSIDGFITREQWPSMEAEVPEGIVMNIRYGQHFLHSKRVLMEKTSMGDGMSELYHFAKGSRGWELVGYEN